MDSAVRSTKRFIALAVGFSFCHIALLAVSGSILIARGLHRLDHAEFPVTALDRTCQVLVLILEEPDETFKRITNIEGWISIIP